MKQDLKTVVEVQGKLALVSSAMDVALNDGGISFEIGEAALQEIQAAYTMLDDVSTRLASMVTV